MARKAQKPKRPPIADLADIDFELDFDLEDFDLTEDGQQTGTRIMTPRLDARQISNRVTFSRAKDFADKIDLGPGARTFAWVSGNFIFGDIIEALILQRHVWPRNIYISTLSMSQENIDSLETVLQATQVERLYLLVSGYFYSHEKYNLIPYLYDHLDVGDKTQIAFGNYHCKIITMETVPGHTITIHGSANLRSSNSIEQVMVEVDQRDLHDFNAGIIRELCDKYGTIDHTAIKVPGKEELWQAAVESTKG